jgi:large subunit ribosomal protein L1
MAKISKNKKSWLEKIEAKKYSLPKAIALLKEFSKTKFDASVELVFRLGVDPKKGEQMVKGKCVLPHGTGKTTRVLVFAKGEAEQKAKKAGADYVGASELIEKIQGGWMDFDRVVATPDMMIEVSKIGKILGPRGMMPNPKMDTVTMDTAGVVQRIKKGQIEFRVDKSANIHTAVGKVSFTNEQILENIETVIATVNRLKPPTSKGIYLQRLFLSSTMGPGIELQVT